MSSTNKTTNYKLSQFIGTDKPTFLGDYNNDMQIIDGAIFEANQSAEQALNDVEAVKGSQAELKNVHTETQEQVAQLKETADGMTGDVTAAQEAANRAEQKATEAQTAATGVLNAANAASANATKAKQTADGNKTALAELTQRVKALEDAPKANLILVKSNMSANGDVSCTEIENYQNLTKDNFIVELNKVNFKGHASNDTFNQNWDMSAVLNYTPSTGVLNVTGLTKTWGAGTLGLNMTLTISIYVKTE